MDRETFAKAWEKHIASLKDAHPEITEEDIAMPEPGEEEARLLMLQKKVGKTRDEIRNWLHMMG